MQLGRLSASNANVAQVTFRASPQLTRDDHDDAGCDARRIHCILLETRTTLVRWCS
jgi:hypothetical protein